MGLSILQPGINPNATTQINGNYNANFSLTIRNHLRTLLDRAGVYSKDGTDLWGEAYTSAGGRNGSVVTAETSAVFKINKYELELPFGTTDTYNNTGGSATTGDVVTAGAIISCGYFSRISYQTNDSGGTKTATIKKNGTTVASKTSTDSVPVFNFTKNDYSSYFNIGDSFEITITTPSGRTLTKKTGQNYSGTHFSFTSQPVAAGSESSYLIYQELTGLNTPAEITHTVPAGTTLATIKSAIGEALVEDWEDGADIQFKLTNATEDTGYLSRSAIQEYTAFTGQATKLIVKLIPKSVSPTAGVPSIRAFGVVCR